MRHDGGHTHTHTTHHTTYNTQHATHNAQNTQHTTHQTQHATHTSEDVMPNVALGIQAVRISEKMEKRTHPES